MLSELDMSIYLYCARFDVGMVARASILIVYLIHRVQITSVLAIIDRIHGFAEYTL
jgi:hypothetical protein